MSIHGCLRHNVNNDIVQVSLLVESKYLIITKNDARNWSAFQPWATFYGIRRYCPLISGCLYLLGSLNEDSPPRHAQAKEEWNWMKERLRNAQFRIVFSWFCQTAQFMPRKTENNLQSGLKMTDVCRGWRLNRIHDSEDPFIIGMMIVPISPCVRAVAIGTSTDEFREMERERGRGVDRGMKCER